MVVKRNTLFSMALKAVGLATSLLIVPITLHYLDSETYGVWLAMSSILFWIAISDFGLTNGMRNYLTEAISIGDYVRARSYISTTLVVLSVIAVALLAVFLLVQSMFDMQAVFNTRAVADSTLRQSLIVAVSLTLVTFVARTIGYVFIALQKYAMSDLLTTLGSVLALLVILSLTKFHNGGLFTLVLAFTGVPVLVYAAASLPVFNRYKALRPDLQSVNTAFAWQVASKGLGFFVIQITSCLVIFGSSNIFIVRYCGPEEVTSYNIAYKFFNLLVVAYTIILAPMWNAYTDAYVKGDHEWIRGAFRRSFHFWLLSVGGGAAMLVFSGWFYRLWVGNEVTVPLATSVCTLLFLSFYNLNNCATYLLNGLNKIRMQIITSVAGTLLYIAMVLGFAGNHGTQGIVLSMALVYAAMAGVHFYQCRLIVGCKAKGIWDK